MMFSRKRDLAITLTCLTYMTFVAWDNYQEKHNSPIVGLPWWDKPNISTCDGPPEVYQGGIFKMHNAIEKYNYSHTIGHCGNRAASNGFNQTVISYTLYGDVSLYSMGLMLMLKNSLKLYPGWLVRLHTDPRDK